MQILALLVCVAIWVTVDVTGLSILKRTADPRMDPEVENQLRGNAREHCGRRCHENPDDCSEDAERDLIVCESLLYWVYFTNYGFCTNYCPSTPCQKDCKPSTCEQSCLLSTAEELINNMKTPDALIHEWLVSRKNHVLKRIGIE